VAIGAYICGLIAMVTAELCVEFGVGVS
jgi:hypothetical protein